MKKDKSQYKISTYDSICMFITSHLPHRILYHAVIRTWILASIRKGYPDDTKLNTITYDEATEIIEKMSRISLFEKE